MRQVMIQQGKAVIEDIPAPLVEEGTVLVSTSYSCISAGTELSGLIAGGKPLWKKALEQPEKVKKVIKMALSDGISKTKGLVENKLSVSNPVGYSLVGTVLESGKGVDDVFPGERVACAGGQYAHHAEIVRIPRNLLAPVPANLELSEASTVTLGAIALQGVRRLNPTLGECFVVIGLGIIGQLTVQLLKANGCHVIGSDLYDERIKLAISLGMDMALDSTSNQKEQVYRLTDGIGADGVIITAASTSNDILSLAFQMCRKKGRVSLVGDVGLDIKREDIYVKELDFYISSSYGPGRYDQNYEAHGLDYPVSYVRWTENRNMAEYLRLVAEKKINIKPLISSIYPLEDAPRAYEDLKKTGPSRPIIALLAYSGQTSKKEEKRRIEVSAPRLKKNSKIGIAIIGGGSFARGMHLPNLEKLSNLYDLRAVCSRTGPSAKSTAKQFKAGYATTDYGTVLADSDIDAVLIATRHNLHAQMAISALKAGKHVLVEKPLAINKEELDTIQAFYYENPDAPILLTGFNRRYSPHMRRIKEIVEKRTNPMIINYRMNAGYIPLDHWVHGAEGGGRDIGEACHIYDLFTFLTDANITKITKHSIHPQTQYYSSQDNFVCVVEFEEGSLASLTYTALGANDHPKEIMTLYVDGQVISMNDYKETQVEGSKKSGILTKGADKGHEYELNVFAKAIKGDIRELNPIWQQIQAMRIAFSDQNCL